MLIQPTGDLACKVVAKEAYDEHEYQLARREFKVVHLLQIRFQKPVYFGYCIGVNSSFFLLKPEYVNQAVLVDSQLKPREAVLLCLLLQVSKEQKHCRVVLAVEHRRVECVYQIAHNYCGVFEIHRGSSALQERCFLGHLTRLPFPTG